MHVYDQYMLHFSQESLANCQVFEIDIISCCNALFIRERICGARPVFHRLFCTLFECISGLDASSRLCIVVYTCWLISRLWFELRSVALFCLRNASLLHLFERADVPCV